MVVIALPRCGMQAALGRRRRPLSVGAFDVTYPRMSFGRSHRRRTGHEHRQPRSDVDPGGAIAMQHVRSWMPLSHLVGARLSVENILAKIRLFDRRETLFTLTRIAGDLANADGGVGGAEARKWTYDLLVQRVGSNDPWEDAVSRAIAARDPAATAIVHAHAVFVLQVLVLRHGTDDGRRASDAELAFLMLALNDHLPEWAEEPRTLSELELGVGSMLFSAIFNQTSDDPVRFVLRTVDIVGGTLQDGPVGGNEWDLIQQEAFGCSFREYAEQFLIPIFSLSSEWGAEVAPVLDPSAWGRGTPVGALYERWFREASASIDTAARRQAEVPGNFSLPGEFYRTPFLLVDRGLLALSPWHVRDHASLGTWAKLNAASKAVLKTTSNQRFTSAFGYLFERWCAAVAREAASYKNFQGNLILPSSPGANDEIEDVVLVDRGRVLLFSAKSTLVREASLRCARNRSVIVDWLEWFFFDDPSSAKTAGYRGGALRLLDNKVQRIRAGEYEHRGLARHSLIVPVVVAFDNVGESGALYKWIEQRCLQLGILSARKDVRPITILTPDDFEGVFALGSRGKSIASLLVEKTRVAERLGRMDRFLTSKSEGRPRTPSAPNGGAVPRAI